MYIESNHEKLMNAIENGDVERVSVLVPFTNCKEYNSKALRLAARDGHTEIVELLVPHSDCKAYNSEALRDASLYGYTKIVKLLLPYCDCKENNTKALVIAKNLEVMALLLPHSDIDNAIKELKEYYLIINKERVIKSLKFIESYLIHKEKKEQKEFKKILDKYL